MVIIDYIHKINGQDILTFKQFCKPSSRFFSDSEAFINSYIGRNNALCYNDGDTIFFLGKLSHDLCFVSSPKGKNWEEKLIEALSSLVNEDDFFKHYKKIWLWELSHPLKKASLQKINFTYIKATVQKRYISNLFGFSKLQQLLSNDFHLRKRWNRFLNILAKREGKKEISCRELSNATHTHGLEAIQLWKRQMDSETSEEKNQIISINNVMVKNYKMLEDVLNNPHLYEGLILYGNSRPLGINVAFRIEKSKNLSGSVLCVDRSLESAGVVLNLLFFENLAKKGYEWLNWGNSYLPSMDKFKQQFHPEEFEYSYEYYMEFN